MFFLRSSIEVFWDDSFKMLPFSKKDFGDEDVVDHWVKSGYVAKDFTGSGVYHKDVPQIFHDHLSSFFGWKDVGLAIYRMDTCEIMPRHVDHFSSYMNRFGVSDRALIRRCVVFLEDWKSGHYFEIGDRAVGNWRAGDAYIWSAETTHIAANIGVEPRYTLQITGTIR